MADLENCMKFGQLIFSKIIKIVANSCQISRLKAPNSISAGALPKTPLGSLQRSLTPLDGFKGAYFWGRGRGKGRGREGREAYLKGKGREKRRRGRGGGKGRKEEGREGKRRAVRRGEGRAGEGRGEEGCPVFLLSQPGNPRQNQRRRQDVKR